MPTNYYVRKTGSDAANGLTPATAWLTIQKAHNAGAGPTGGDTVYVGAGTYREVVTANMAAPGSELKFVADTDGANALDPGEVIWTAYLTNDTTAPSGASLLTVNSKTHLTYQKFTMVFGSSTYGVDGTPAAGLHTIFRDCTMIGNQTGDIIGIQVPADTNVDWLVERCSFIGPRTNHPVHVFPTRSSLADYDMGIVIQNCLMVGGVRALLMGGIGAGAFFGGGLKFLNNTVVGAATEIMNVSVTSTTIPVVAYNNALVSFGGLTAAVLGQIVEDFNLIQSNTPRTNVAAGANSKTSPTVAYLLSSGSTDLHGFLRRSFFVPFAGSPVLGFGNSGAVAAPTVDFENRPRPAGGGSTANSIGAYERHDTGAREASVVDASTYSLKLTGPADHDLLIPVDATATTLTVRARYDTNHAATNKPQVILQANGEIGVAAQTVTMTAAVDTWETLTVTVTPTAKGFVTLRLVSRSAAGNGIAYFDTLHSTSSIGTGNEDYWRFGEAFPAATTTGVVRGWHFP